MHKTVEHEIDIPAIAQLLNRYGISWDDLARGHRIERPNSRYLFLLPADHDNLGLSPRLRESSGMMLMKARLQHPKLSTSAARWLGRYATRNMVRLSQPQEAKIYMAREPLQLTADQLIQVDQWGYVLVFYRSWPIGLGTLSPKQDGYELQSLFPKGWSPGGLSLEDIKMSLTEI